MASSSGRHCQTIMKLQLERKKMSAQIKNLRMTIGRLKKQIPKKEDLPVPPVKVEASIMTDPIRLPARRCVTTNTEPVRMADKRCQANIKTPAKVSTSTFALCTPSQNGSTALSEPPWQMTHATARRRFKDLKDLSVKLFGETDILEVVKFFSPKEKKIETLTPKEAVELVAKTGMTFRIYRELRRHEFVPSLRTFYTTRAMLQAEATGSGSTTATDEAFPDAPAPDSEPMDDTPPSPSESMTSQAVTIPISQPPEPMPPICTVFPSSSSFTQPRMPILSTAPGFMESANGTFFNAPEYME